VQSAPDHPGYNPPPLLPPPSFCHVNTSLATPSCAQSWGRGGGVKLAIQAKTFLPLRPPPSHIQSNFKSPFDFDESCVEGRRRGKDSSQTNYYFHPPPSSPFPTSVAGQHAVCVVGYCFVGIPCVYSLSLDFLKSKGPTDAAFGRCCRTTWAVRSVRQRRAAC